MQCFAKAIEFLDLNRGGTTGVLHLETFDPHEPFFAPSRFRNAFKTDWKGPIRDWPRYDRVDELPDEVEELRGNYYRVIALCDFLIGRIIDYFDAHDIWERHGTAGYN